VYNKSIERREKRSGKNGHDTRNHTNSANHHRKNPSNNRKNKKLKTKTPSQAKMILSEGEKPQLLSLDKQIITYCHFLKQHEDNLKSF
jgi:hypothetical protein